MLYYNKGTLLLLCLCRWLPHCVSLFEKFADAWLPLVPKKASLAPVKICELLNCVAALMSLQLRSLVIASLHDLLQFLQLHQV